MMATTIASTGASSLTPVDIRDFPAFYTLQPNPSTRLSQCTSFSALLLAHFRRTRSYILTLDPATLSQPPFANPAIRRALAPRDARAMLDWMASKEGGERVEWIAEKGVEKGREARCWVYWRRPEEWAALVYAWVEETGQKGAVLTLFEIVEGEATRAQEFYGMDQELLRKSLNVLVKQGKAQIFGTEDSLGVKFF